MTSTVVAPAVPTTRPASAPVHGSGGAESAAPFASALDGALSENQAPVGDGSADADAEGTPDQSPETAVHSAEVAAVAVAVATVPAAVWALALGQLTGEAAAVDGDTAVPPATAVDAGAGQTLPIPAIPATPATPATLPGVAVAEAGVQGPTVGLRDGAVPSAGVPDGPGVPGEPGVPDGPGVPSRPEGIPAGRPATSAAGAAPAAPATGAVPAPVPVAASAAAAVQAQAQLRAALDAAVTSPATPVPAIDVVVAADAAPAPVGTAPVVPVPLATTRGDSTPESGGVPSAAASGVVAPAAPAGGSLSAGADGAGQESGRSGAPAGDGVTEMTSAGSTAPTATAAAPSADIDSVTRTAASQPVSSQVARQVAVLRGAADGSHTMTLVLTPETLGPVEVSVTVTRGTLDLTLRGANEHGRAALLDALPELRRDLESAGLSCSKLEVDRGTGDSRFSGQSTQHSDRQQAFGDRGGQARGDARSRPWLGAADTQASGPTPASQRTTSSGVDVRV